MIRVLIVDDSATMRSLIANVLQRDPDIEIVGEAGDPLEAREAIKQRWLCPQSVRPVRAAS